MLLFVKGNGLGYVLTKLLQEKIFLFIQLIISSPFSVSQTFANSYLSGVVRESKLPFAFCLKINKLSNYQLVRPKRKKLDSDVASVRERKLSSESRRDAKTNRSGALPLRYRSKAIRYPFIRDRGHAMHTAIGSTVSKTTRVAKEREKKKR